MTADVLVVTVAYRSSGTIGAFLDSLVHAGSCSRELVVVDNDSPDADRTAAVVEARGGMFHGLSENRGYGGGVNAGVAASGSDAPFILVVNPDVVFHDGAVDALLAAAQAHPEAGALGPRILEPTGQVYPSARRLPSIPVGAGHAVFGALWPGNPWTRRYRREHEPGGDTPSATGWLSGACLLVRRDAWYAVGGFDEGYFMYFEDVDLGARLGAQGWANLYVPEAVVTHEGGVSTSQVSGRMLREHHRSAYRYLSRQYRHWYHAPLRLLLRTGLALRYRRAASRATASCSRSARRPKE